MLLVVGWFFMVVVFWLVFVCFVDGLVWLSLEG